MLAHIFERGEKSLKIQLCVRKVQGDLFYRMGAFLGTFLGKKIDFQGKGDGYLDLAYLYRVQGPLPQTGRRCGVPISYTAPY
jgi:hypothetical protein